MKHILSLILLAITGYIFKRIASINIDIQTAVTYFMLFNIYLEVIYQRRDK